MAVSNAVRQFGLILAGSISGVLVFALGISSFGFWLFLRLPANPAPGIVVVDIRPGQDAVTIGKLLEAQGIVSDANKFFLLCLLRKSSHRLQAGEYAFRSPSTPLLVLDQLVKGRVLEHRVTIPEGSTVWDVARIVSQSGLAPEEALLALTRDRGFIESLSLVVQSLEGYLFPDTYFFRKSQSPSVILKTLVHQFRVHFPDEWVRRANEGGLTVQEVVTLASMVEKEAKVDGERPIIAAVFLNRLRQDMPLQCDPTTIYDLPGFVGPITPQELKRASPYNTYVNKGLPVGPICSPGVKSLRAVLYPEKVAYLYFVSNNDGTHRFSETLSEHREAVADYYGKRRASSRGEAASMPYLDSHPTD